MNKFKTFSFCLLITSIVSIILLLISSAIFAYTNINDRHLQSFVFGIVMLSVLIGSVLLSKKIKVKGLLYGGIFGLVFCLLIYLITSIFFTGFSVSNTLLLYAVISILSGVVGGVIGVNI